jgi:hypothetical protein
VSCEQTADGRRRVRARSKERRVKSRTQNSERRLMADDHAPQHVDRLTVIAIAAIAYAAVNITHEIIGHCGMDLVMGTRCTVISTTYIPLAQIPPAWKYNIIVVAGCAANFTVGLISFALLRRLSAEASATFRFFLWLLMCVNLFLASTYIAVAPIIKFGDSYILIQNLPWQIFWRPAVALVGALAWWLSFRAARIELARLIGTGGRAARSIALELVVPAYLTGGIMTVTSALFSQLAAKWAQLEAAGGTFGLTIWLLLLPFVVPERVTFAAQPFRVPRSLGWILAGALTAAIFIGILGRGIAMSS